MLTQSYFIHCEVVDFGVVRLVGVAGVVAHLEGHVVHAGGTPLENSCCLLILAHQDFDLLTAATQASSVCNSIGKKVNN